MMNLKELGRDMTPPILWRWLRRAKMRLASPEFEVVPSGWQAAHHSRRIKGWDVAGVLAAYQAAWPDFVRRVSGTGPLERAPDSLPGSGPDAAYHNLVHCYGYVLARAAWQHPSISMLDWGGGLGQYLLISQALMPGLAIDYHCKDLPMLAAAGQQLFPAAHFYHDESCLQREYDLVLANLSLHYSEDWVSAFRKLAGATTGYLYVSGLPTLHDTASFVYVQRPYRYGYNTEYLAWCLNRAEWLSAAEANGLRLVREFSLGYQIEIAGAPEPGDYRGYLFVPA